MTPPITHGLEYAYLPWPQACPTCGDQMLMAVPVREDGGDVSWFISCSSDGCLTIGPRRRTMLLALSAFLEIKSDA